MKLICAGLPKTGTKSVASALRILGYNVHDTEEHWSYHVDEYNDAMEGKQIPDFAAMYASVDAVTDNPACFFWEEMIAAFPNAKVLLMVRDSGEAWVESVERTFSVMMSVRSSLWMRLGFLCTPTGRIWKKIAPDIRKKLGLNPYGSTFSTDVYTKHNARVQSSIPRDQLLVYNVKQGWKPLCEFLGVDIPDVSFPRLNVKSELIEDLMKNSQFHERMAKELCLILASIVLICAVLAWLIRFSEASI